MTLCMMQRLDNNHVAWRMRSARGPYNSYIFTEIPTHRLNYDDVLGIGDCVATR